MTDATPRRERARWLLAIFFVCAGFNMALARWLPAAFFLAGGLFFLKRRQIESQPKSVRFLLVAALAALAAAMFVKLIFDLQESG